MIETADEEMIEVITRQLERVEIREAADTKNAVETETITKPVARTVLRALLFKTLLLISLGNR